MKDLHFHDRLISLKGFDVSRDELRRVEVQWLGDGANIETLIAHLHMDGTRRKALTRAFDGLGPDEMLSLLQAWTSLVEVRKAETPPTRICVTGIDPEGFREPLMDTVQAFQEVVSCARKRLIIIGYRLNDGDKVLMSSLEAGMRDRGLEVCLITDHLMGRLNMDDQKRMLSWLGESRMNFRLWTFEAENKMELMHVKCMMADTSTAYIGSANFSYGGAQRNVELGLLVRDRCILGALGDLFNFMISGQMAEVQSIGMGELEKGGNA